MDRAPARSFEDLVVWQKSHQLTLRVYRITSDFPNTEIYGLVSQMRRAAVSVSANIAEGFKRRSRTDKARLLNVAQGSLEELRYYFILARDLAYIATASGGTMWKRSLECSGATCTHCVRNQRFAAD
jgi:four helix bundle protein